jgi:hypothetical protein
MYSHPHDWIRECRDRQSSHRAGFFPSDQHSQIRGCRQSQNVAMPSAYRFVVVYEMRAQKTNWKANVIRNIALIELRKNVLHLEIY